MKFARVLRTTAEDLPDLPELQALFSAYKHLKKAIKRLPDKDTLKQQHELEQLQQQQQQQLQQEAGVARGAALTAEAAADAAASAGAAAAALLAHNQAEAAFVDTLGRTLAQMNDLFLEKEETSVIRVEQLEGALAAAGAHAGRLESLHKEFVDFHGEVLLLVHWSILAYTATVKILKKHHKRTGLLLRAPLGNLLSQPFCSTEVSARVRVLAAMCFVVLVLSGHPGVQLLPAQLPLHPCASHLNPPTSTQPDDDGYRSPR